MSKYVVDAGVILRLLAEDLEWSSEHSILAPTLIRSEVLAALYRQVRRGDLPEAEARDRLARFATMKIRYLGDKVLRSVAWSIAAELGWETTETAEYVSLTHLQADAFITLDDDLAARLDGVVETASLDALW